MSRRVVIAVVLAVLVAPVAATPAAATPPDPPAAYYGEVVVGGEPAPAGVTVSAAVNGSVVDTIETDASGAFGGSGAFDEKLVVNGESGQPVTLRVGGHAVKTVEWSSGDNRQVTLELSDTAKPTPSIHAPDSVEKGVTVELDGSGSTDDVGVVSYEWSLPGGETASGPTPDVTFSKTGEQTVELTVTDAGGNTATKAVSVDVTSSGDGGSGDDGSSGDGGTGDGGTGDGQAGGGQSGSDDTPPSEPSVSVGSDAVSVSFPELPANQPTTVSLPETAATNAGGVSMGALDVETTEASEVSLDVSVSAEPPEGIESPGPDTVAFVNVDESVTEETLAGVDFSFGVSAERLQAFDASAEDVSLWRYHAGEWNELDTRVASETESGYEFVAESPGLSVFAVRTASPDVSIGDASIADSAVEVGDDVSLSATLVNDGGADGERSVTFYVAGDEVAERTVTVPANDERTVVVSFTAEQTGSFEVLAGNVSAGTLDVSQQTTQAPPNQPDDPTPPGQREQSGFSPLTVAALGFVIAAMLGLFLLARRRA